MTDSSPAGLDSIGVLYICVTEDLQSSSYIGTEKLRTPLGPPPSVLTFPSGSDDICALNSDPACGSEAARAQTDTTEYMIMYYSILIHPYSMNKNEVRRLNVIYFG